MQGGIRIYSPRDITKVDEKNSTMSFEPTTFYLYQNYPNPFNPMTSFRFTLPVAGQVTIRIFDIRGREVETLVNADMPAGEHKVTWNGKDKLGMAAPSGIYFYQTQFNGQILTGKMTLVQ